MIKRNIAKTLSALLTLLALVSVITIPALAAPVPTASAPARQTAITHQTPSDPAPVTDQSHAAAQTPADTATPLPADSARASVPSIAGTPALLSAGSSIPAAADPAAAADTQAAAAQPAPSGGLTATPTASTVIVDGRSVSFDAYNIGGNNYFKLRDLAFTLNGSIKQFGVGWDAENNAISLFSGRSYLPLGGEMASGDGGARTPTPTSSAIYLNGREVQFTAYNIDGNNYFKLRDIGLALNFTVDWDGSRNTIVIDTSRRYYDESGATSYSGSYYGAAQGSAKILDGRSLLVSIFISRSGVSWSGENVATALRRLGGAADWMESESRRYGRDAELIYDFNENTDLRYNMTYDGEFYEFPDVVLTYYEDEDDLMGKTNADINDFIEANIPYLALADKYETDSIAYIIFIDYGSESRSYAYQYSVGGLSDRYHEKTFLMGMSTPASTIAHELLHVFGATDFYVEGPYMGISQEMVRYAADTYPLDIFVTSRSYDDDGNLYTDSIPEKQVSPLTAYRIGWLDELPELSQFPNFEYYPPAAVMNRLFETNGIATWIYNEGHEYTGNFVYGVREGQGRMVYPGGEIYEGLWVNGERQGHGVMTWPEGHVYDGNWANSQRSGHGVMTSANGQVYDGNWEKDTRSGQGVMTWPSGQRYEGAWAEGVFSGHGDMTYATGETYTGEWVDGLRSGQGTMTWPAGHVYEGAWSEGARNGYGVMTYPDGRVQAGMWENSEFIG